AGAALVLALGLLGGRAWWTGVDAAYRTGLYQPLHATPTARSTGSGRVLRLAIDDTTRTDAKRQWTPLVPDHGHLMHLFLVRDSSLDGFAHLHPLPLDSTTFEAALPPRPEPYMGMAGHAMIARNDGKVLAHLHPAGTISLAALETFVLRQPGDTVRGALVKRLAAMQTGMGEPGDVGSGVISFPYA